MRRMLCWLCLGFSFAGSGLVYAQAGIDAQITSIAWSLDGTRIAASFDDTTVKVWGFGGETELGMPLLSFHPDRVDKIEWTPDSSYLVVQGTSGSEDNPLRTQVTKWDANTGELIQTLLDYQVSRNLVSVPHIDFSYYPVVGVNRTFTAMAYSLSSRTVTLSNTLSTIDVDACGFYGVVQSIVWSPDDSRIVVICGGMDGNQIQIFDVASTQPINLIQYLDYTYDLQWSTDGSQLAALSVHPSANGGYIIRVYKITQDDNELLVFVRAYDETRSVALAWRPHDDVISIASAKGIEVFDLSSETSLTQVEPMIISPEAATAVTWSPDGQYVAGGLTDGSLHVWKTSVT